ncbi:hypothetical protein HDU98_012232, partial [Podochytrium sp. JEL0797]
MFFALLTCASLAAAQYDPNGPTQPGLPQGCLGSFPNITYCEQNNWYVPTPDPCKPDTIPLPSEQVYIKDQNNF